jgi:hypothetical protein
MPEREAILAAHARRSAIHALFAAALAARTMKDLVDDMIWKRNGCCGLDDDATDDAADESLSSGAGSHANCASIGIRRLSLRAVPPPVSHDHALVVVPLSDGGPMGRWQSKIRVEDCVR